MNIHVLAGDALAENFSKTGIDGDVVICRECLIDGNVKAENLDDFWDIRANFIRSAYGENEGNYFNAVVAELQKLNNLSPETEVNLWFEYELFCQTNMWFCLFLLCETEAKIFRIAPVVRENDKIWKGFGGLSEKDLRQCFEQKIRFENKEVELGANLWRAYQNSDYEKLERLSETNSLCFPFLKEVCRAEIEKNSRPKKVLREIAEKGFDNFTDIFTEFSRRAGVYGFGDAQVKRIMRQM